MGDRGAAQLTGLDVLGRLLFVGVLGGAVAGALTGAVLALSAGWSPYGGWVVAAAAVVGTVLGPVVQVLTAAVVLALPARPSGRAAAVAVPVAAALLLSAFALVRLDLREAEPLVAGLTVAVAVGTTALVTLRSRPWCLGR